MMKELFNNIIEGLKSQGYKEQGGGTLFRILKDRKGNTIKVFAHPNYENPLQIIVRYACKDLAEPLSIEEAANITKKFMKDLPDDIIDVDIGSGL